VIVDNLQQKLWDPGLINGSAFIAIARYCAGFHWDPGSLEDLQPIWLLPSDHEHHYEIFTAGLEHHPWDPGLPASLRLIQVARSGGSVGPNYFHGLVFNLLMQQKCGGCLHGILACTMLHYAQLQSVYSIAWNVMCKLGIVYTVCLEFEDLTYAQWLFLAIYWCHDSTYIWGHQWEASVFLSGFLMLQ
jgi:hypothetical protein